MENSLYIGLSRQMALRRQMDVVANNIANMNTAGFRSQQMLFLEQVMEADKPGVTQDTEVSMVIDQGVARDLRPGRLEQTGNPMDVAVQGEGYMVVDTPSGPRYTRSGHLAVDDERRLTDASGLPIMSTEDQPFVIPQTARDVTIAANGDVSYIDSAGDPTQPVALGRIKLVAFNDEVRMTTLGGGLYVTNEAPHDAQNTDLIQGAIEHSNVQPVVEMTRMIEISRQYSSNQRLLESEHERINTAIRRLGRMAQG
jgi:flagellar basal-body rod protein FlgF